MVTKGPGAEVGRALDAFVTEATVLPNTKEVEQGATELFLEHLDSNTAPLTDWCRCR